LEVKEYLPVGKNEITLCKHHQAEGYFWKIYECKFI